MITSFYEGVMLDFAIFLTPCDKFLDKEQFEAYKATMETDLYISVYGDYRDEA